MMTTNPAAERIATPPAAPATKTPKSAIADDMAMIRAASELTRDLVNPNARIYWVDFLGSAFIGYAGVAAAILAPSTAWMLAAALIAVVALYRAGSFIHELTHIRKNALPGFRLVWNLLVGIPLLIPSFLYEGIHSLHHNRTKYGTVEDPEYLPLALMKPWSLPVFLISAILLPLALLCTGASLDFRAMFRSSNVAALSSAAKLFLVPCLMTLAGWALVELALRERGEDCDVFVGESTVRYLAPVWTDFRADAVLAQLPDDAKDTAGLAALRARMALAVQAGSLGDAADLERRVAAVLDADPRTKINGLKVTSQGDGVVMISGSPANGIMGRDLALRAASRVPGVRSVANNMTMN